MSRRTKIWLQGMAAACIAGAANSLVVVVVDPLTFNPFIGGAWSKLGAVAVASSLMGVGLYLAKSPIPQRMARPAEIDEWSKEDTDGSVTVTPIQ